VAESGEEESGHEMGHDCTIRMASQGCQRQQRRRNFRQAHFRVKSCKSGQDPSAVSTWVKGECRILMLWRWMRWQSWHRNVGRCDGQTGIMADLDREAINAQQKTSR
jgi:hypothetical protein